MTAPAAIRTAQARDLVAINDLYNHYVLSSECTLQTVPSTLPEREAWFASLNALPCLVAEEEGHLVGWGALVPFSPREGYRFTAEDSVYVHPSAQGRGVGRALLTELLVRAESLGLRSVIGRITATQTASLSLHQKLGFVEAGRFPDLGFKFNRWLEVVYVQRLLTRQT